MAMVDPSLRGPWLSFRAGDLKISALPSVRDYPEERKPKRNSLVSWNRNVAIVDA
jgi:hypothetical protein